MKKVLLLVVCSSIMCVGSFAQNITSKLQKAFGAFENDEQLKHAMTSLYVIDAATGKVVFDKNSQVGLAPASTQKVITSVTAFELLGKDYMYKTFFSMFNNSIFVYGNLDPTLGSWRYSKTVDTILFDEIIKGLEISRNKMIEDIIIQPHSEDQVRTVPSGWIYQDIGNYYGASPFFLNWKENQFDITFTPGLKVGDPTNLDTLNTVINSRYVVNEVKTGREGSGDNAYVYFLPNREEILIEGTIPNGVKKFSISASDHFPSATFAIDFVKFAKLKKLYNGSGGWSSHHPSPKSILDFSKLKPQFVHYSPSLDSIIYWFNKKSINLYGEALVKTFAYQKNGFGSTDDGVKILKEFWKQKGLDEDELNISDGSGLSPQNRVTTHAQVEILKYAKTKDWFPYFLNSLPDYNGMSMKSGTIKDVKGFCGYHKAKDGKEYIFSFLVNNYNGKTSPLVAKMYKVLDELK